MGERDQTRMVERRDQDTGRDADRLLHVVMLDLLAISKHAVALGKDHDQIGGNLKKRFVLVGAQRGERIQPFRRCLVMIELVLFLLRFRTHPAFDCRIAGRDEVPRLHIGAAGRGACRPQALFNHLARHRPVGEFAHRAPPAHVGVELGRSSRHLLHGILLVGRIRSEIRMHQSHLLGMANGARAEP